MSCIELIGISGLELDPHQHNLLASCSFLVVSRRHLSLIDGYSQPVIPITPIKEMVEKVQQALMQGSVAVLASGDPLFYGIGRNLLSSFPHALIRIHPALSAVQLACARFKIPWDDLTLTSLHGRDKKEIISAILRQPKTMLFTDGTNSPDIIAQRLMTTLEAVEDQDRLAAITVRVAENLALPEERISEGTVHEIARSSFSPLNMMLIEQPKPQENGCFGLSEPDICHSRGLITKDEVRAVNLHKLCLPTRGVFWDIGGGSGSISLEAARMNPELSVYTIEKKPEEQDNIKNNIKKYAAFNMHLVKGEAPEALALLPSPDRVFIGGSGGRMSSIIDHVNTRLLPGGRVVVNAVLAKNTRSSLSCRSRTR
ncbi:MAG: bifunctional cobalt-precorrin-7 (C(5))-methyltransferase/cobalt-precorrin-6B (C(15))-methyltransferase [Desulfobulbus propionicus]|nr:MAG: bifunctional cobalt-precorrin-7 (C(5))-methyltransferase/cobalt-precorrin-6B (C(15))-methyltransferase [Desulfobulbus propionicus]